MAKWVSLLLSFVMNGNSRDRKTEIVLAVAFEQVRKVAMLLCGALALSLTLVGGLFLVLIEGSYTYEDYAFGGVLSPSVLFYSGIATMILSGSALLLLFMAKNWKVPASKTEAPKQKVSAIEEAVTLLIQDFVKERQMKRAKNKMSDMAPVEASIDEPRKQAVGENVFSIT